LLPRVHRPRFLATGILALAVSASASLAADGEVAAPPTQRVAILADAGGQGELHPCRCPGLNFSSLALRTEVLKRSRTYTYPAVLLEGGDFTAPEDDSLRAERFTLFVNAMATMDYDAVGLGDEELGLDPAAIRSAAAKLPLVCANLADGAAWGIPPVRRVDRGGFHILITGYVDPSLIMGNNLLDPMTSLARVLPTMPAADSTIVILLAHAPETQFREVLERFPSIDVVVRSHAAAEGPALETVDMVPVLLPAPKGRNVVQLTADFSPLGSLVSRMVRTWELKQEHEGHTRVEAMVHAFETRHGLH
jgi:2',3'-cyclic-nucleotide 2'-phosphodiesterase (5'-nucleotidase family)